MPITAREHGICTGIALNYARLIIRIDESMLNNLKIRLFINIKWRVFYLAEIQRLSEETVR